MAVPLKRRDLVAGKANPIYVFKATLPLAGKKRKLKKKNEINPFSFFFFFLSPRSKTLITFRGPVLRVTKNMVFATLKQACSQECLGAQDAFKDSMIH
jgi:hypothetical protein